MKRELAETLLAKIMGWSDAVKAGERARLESFARYKYDEYQQFSPGRRFVESLALWLAQFAAGPDRQAAYDFVRSRLIFISADEMNHLVELAFPTIIRPRLIAEVAAELDMSPHQVKAVTGTREYRARLRRTLFLGLSDGARTDWFRRANPQDVSNEQIFHAYDISDAKSASMVEELRKDLLQMLGHEPTEAEALFQQVVLLDDFAGSGTSMIREEPGSSSGWKGKVDRIVKMMEEQTGLGAAIAGENVEVTVILYVAADQAIDHIEQRLPRLAFSKGELRFEVVHRLGSGTPLDDAADASILALARDDRLFDKSADDEHAKVGGSSKQLGYANCRLPVVLSHNTPNNSIYLLWAEENETVRGLFPRVSRHRKRQ